MVVVSVARTNQGQRRTLVFRYLPSGYAYRWEYTPPEVLLCKPRTRLAFKTPLGSCDLEQCDCKQSLWMVCRGEHDSDGDG